MAIYASTLDVTRDASVGNLTVSGTTTTIDTVNLLVEDKNIVIGDAATPNDVTTADGGGITLKGTTLDKTILWDNNTDSWNFNQKIAENTGTSFAQRPFTALLIMG